MNVLDSSLCIYYHVSTHAQLIRNAVKIAKVFTHGNSQAVRLPKEFRFEDSEVIIRKVGESILLTPKKHRWKNLEASLSLFEGKIERNQPTEIEIREWPWQ
jgi:antitoxin VapB